MKKTALFAVALAFVVPTSAKASTLGAKHAVERKIAFDVGDDYRVKVECHQRKRNRSYACDVTLYQFTGGSHINSGRAQVTQAGSRYRVSYRIDW